MDFERSPSAGLNSHLIVGLTSNTERTSLAAIGSFEHFHAVRGSPFNIRDFLPNSIDKSLRNSFHDLSILSSRKRRLRIYLEKDIPLEKACFFASRINSGGRETPMDLAFFATAMRTFGICHVSSNSYQILKLKGKVKTL